MFFARKICRNFVVNKPVLQKKKREIYKVIIVVGLNGTTFAVFYGKNNALTDKKLKISSFKGFVWGTKMGHIFIIVRPKN